MLISDDSHIGDDRPCLYVLDAANRDPEGSDGIVAFPKQDWGVILANSNEAGTTHVRSAWLLLDMV
jgi:hypothetical protein